jgi:nucleoside-diphosphate-sugar epimerase
MMSRPMSSKRSAVSRRDHGLLLLTGCYGSLGSRLAHRLIEGGWRVEGIDLSTARRRRLPRGMKVHHLDLAGTPNLKACVERCDGIIHLAGLSRVGDAYRRPFEAIRANIMSTANLLEAIRMSPRRPWLLFASSLEVKTDARGAYELTNMYGLTKAASELLSHRYAADYGLITAAARIGGIYGAIDDYADKVPLVFARRALEGRPIRVAAGQRLMTYIHVDDVCRSLIAGIRRLMRMKSPAYCVLDIRTTRQVGLLKLAHIVRRAAGADVSIEAFELPIQRDLDARTLAGPQPRVSLEQGLSALVLALRRAER